MICFFIGATSFKLQIDCFQLKRIDAKLKLKLSEHISAPIILYASVGFKAPGHQEIYTDFYKL